MKSADCIHDFIPVIVWAEPDVRIMCGNLAPNGIIYCCNNHMSVLRMLVRLLLSCSSAAFVYHSMISAS